MISKKKKKRGSIRKTYSLMQPHGECCMYPTTHHSRAWRRWAKVALWEKPARDSCAGSQLGLIFNYSGLVEKSPHLKRLKTVKADSTDIQEKRKKKRRRKIQQSGSTFNMLARRICRRHNEKMLIWHQMLFFWKTTALQLNWPHAGQDASEEKKKGGGGKKTNHFNTAVLQAFLLEQKGYKLKSPCYYMMLSL